MSDQWNGLLEKEWLENLDASPFLQRCREGRVTLEELESFAVQHFHYSRHFTRYLCALLSNIRNDGDRLHLVDNLVDEMGLGKTTATPHSQLYREMLAKLGWTPETHTPHPETVRLVETMLESCRNPNPLIGLGALCLGAEAIVPHIYQQIIAGFRANHVDDEKLLFFKLHVECDDDHARTMKEIIERDLDTEEKRSMLKCSAARTIAARARFFGSISEVMRVAV